MFMLEIRSARAPAKQALQNSRGDNPRRTSQKHTTSYGFPSWVRVRALAQTGPEETGSKKGRENEKLEGPRNTPKGQRHVFDTSLHACTDQFLAEGPDGTRCHP